VQSYGIVVHSGRWHIAAADSASGQNRTFRVDRISNPRTQPGTFTVPSGFDPRDHVLSGLAKAPYRHRISIRVAASGDHVRARLPASLTTVSDLADDDGWVRVEMRTEQLDWVPALLAGLGCPFTVERPDALRDLVRELADQLTAAAGPDPR
jgi:predicted DNA-binding transcriptional regulator YafY